MFAAGNACVRGVTAASGGPVLPEEELGVGDGDLDLPLKLGMESRWPKFRTPATTRSRIRFFPDLLLLVLDIPEVLFPKSAQPTPVHLNGGATMGWLWWLCQLCKTHNTPPGYG